MLPYAFAADLGKGFKADGYFTSGKLWDVQRNDQVTTLTTQRGSYFIQGELGLRYDGAIAGVPLKALRPFFEYESLTNNYEKETYGLDTFFYSSPAIGSIGLRTSFTNMRLGTGKQKYYYSGIMWVF